MDDKQVVYCWGANKLGQCGIGKVKPEYIDLPKKLN